MNGSSETLRRILGSTGPDAGCTRSAEVLDRFVEAERAGRATGKLFRAVATHLEACPDCREDYLGLQALLAETGDDPGSDTA